MNPLIAKLVMGGAGSALLSVAALGAGAPVVALAANLPAAAAKATAPAKAGAATKEQRASIRLAVTEAEADALGMTPDQLRDAIRSGKSVEDIATAKGMTKDKVVDKTVAALKPRLAALVAAGQITQKQADRALDHVQKGHLPGWKGDKHHKRGPATTAPAAPAN